MSRPSISIAMATYNGARFIREQLDSLAAQSHRPHELVVCDDGSTDATLEIVEQFAGTAPFPVRVHRNEANLGYVRNFLKAASLCDGDWIAFCDQDDVWFAGKLAAVDAAVEACGDAVLVVHPALVVDEALKPSGRIHPRLPRRRVLAPLGQPLWLKTPGFCCTFDARLVRLIPHDHLPTGFFAAHRTQSADKRIVWLANVLGSTVVLQEPQAWYRRHLANVSALPSQQRAARDNAVTPGFDTFRAGVSAEYARELERFAALDQPPLFQRRLVAGAAYYDRMAAWHRLRPGLFAPRAGTRFGSFAGLLRRHAYWGRRGRGLGLRAFARDLALLFRPPRPSAASGARQERR